MSRFRHQIPSRRGAVAPFFAIMLVPIVGMVAFAVDYGYLLVIRTDLQRAADAAVLAAVQDLIPAADGSQDLQAARSTVRQYVRDNLNDSGFEVLDSDITIGRYDPETIYANLAILDTGIADTVRVTLRRDDLANSSVSLFFARLLRIGSSAVSVTSTAVLQKARFVPPGGDILPMSIPEATWEQAQPGELWSIYGDGRMVNQAGQRIPGNWGTVDIGAESNSAETLVDQILNGLRQEDVDALYSDDRISSDQYIDSQDPMWLQADTGLSSGLKSAVQAVHGKTKLIPIYRAINDAGGNNLQFFVVAWGVVEVVDSHWRGNNNSSVEIRKSYTYDGKLRPNNDLANTSDVIEGAFTSPVLVQ